MKSTHKIKQLDACKRLLKIEIAPEEIVVLFDEVYKEMQKEVVLPGFRRGNAPLDLIKKNHSEYARKRVLELAIEDSYRDAMKQAGILSVGSPAIENVKFPQDGILSFEATFEIRPAVNLKNYKGLKVKKKSETVKDEDVDKSLESLRQLGAQYKTVPERPIKEGDFVLSDLVWFVENMPIDKREKVLLPIEKNTLTQDVFSGILGSIVGEKKSMPVNIDKNFPKPEYVGKSAVLEITVHEIKEKELPALDDDFAKDLGISSGIKALREKVKDRLKLEKQEAVRLDIQDQIVLQLLKSHSFDLPQSLVEDEFQNLLEESKRKLLHQGYNKEQAEEIFQKEKENLAKTLKPHAENQVKTFFILEEIAEKENLSVSEEELKQFIEVLAARQGQKDAAGFRRQLEKEQRLNSLYWQLTEAKVMQLLVDNAKIEDEKNVSS